MEKVIYKYKLDPEDVQYLEIPMSSEFLSANTQLNADRFNPSKLNEEIFVWYLVPTDKSVMKTKRTIAVLGTGHSFDDAKYKMKYLDTVFFKTKNLVFHIFESEL